MTKSLGNNNLHCISQLHGKQFAAAAELFDGQQL